MDQQTCLKRGGEWGRFGLVVNEQCNLPTKDAGKVCQDQADCEGACIAELGEAETRELEKGNSMTTSGKCSERTLNFGCFPFVHQGRVPALLCVD